MGINHQFAFAVFSSFLTCVGLRYFLHAVTCAMTLAWLSLLTLMPFTLMMHWPGWRPAMAATVPGVRRRKVKERGESRQGQQPWHTITQVHSNKPPPKKNNWCIFHILYTKLGWTTFLFFCLCIYNLVSCFGSTGVWGRAGEEGSCLSGVRRGPLWGMWFKL